jgi:8-oxo-dGTP pyrophosphatase MutT (NUDIX family)
MEPQEIIFDKDFIKSKLKSLDSPNRLCFYDDSFKKSAIAFLIVPYNNKSYDLILIRRTKQESDKHSGEMSFTGGKFDPSIDKSLQDTALRETEEELGISRDKINILGTLDDHITPKKFIITPIVGYINPEQKLSKEDKEVQEIVRVPISFFANIKNYKKKNYMLKNNLIEVGNYTFKALNGIKYVIFGATSHIIVTFIESVYNIKLMKEGARRLRCEDFKQNGVETDFAP